MRRINYIGWLVAIGELSVADSTLLSLVNEPVGSDTSAIDSVPVDTLRNAVIWQQGVGEENAGVHVVAR